MTGGEELAGKAINVTGVTRVFLISLLLCSLIAGCNQSQDGKSSETQSDSKTLTVSNLYENCGDILFAALYHLPNTQQFFENPDKLIGQPAYYFSDLLTQESKENILMQLAQHYKQADGNDELVLLNRSINQWCEAYQTIQSLQHQQSYEEFLAELFKSDRFEYLFYQYSESPIFQSNEFSAFEKVASLSSAQGQNIVSTLSTDLAMQSPTDFEIDISALKALYQS
jgi:hypothetical protein